MRKPLIAGNWKMNKTSSQARRLTEQLKDGHTHGHVEVAVCPPFTALESVAEVLENTRIKLGAQNVHFEDAGAFTGEVSVSMLKDLGAELVIVGHSERRQIFGETDELINKKVKKVLANDMTPILCVGETLEEREQDKTEQVVKGQVTEDLKGLTQREIAKVIIAYEPIWAIGTGKSATAAEADRVIGYIRGVLAKLTGKEQAGMIRILYGGSVKAANADSLLGQPQIDGALVGGASLKADEFLTIIKHAAGKEQS